MKDFSLENRIVPSVAKMKGYVPGEQPNDSDWTKLNTNEFPYPPSPQVAEAIREKLGDIGECLRLYPNPDSSKLREEIAKYFGLQANCVIAGNGSDDVLNLAVRAFSDVDLKIATFDPSYSLYPVLSKIQGSQLIEIPFLENMQIDYDKLFSCGANILFFTNPNAPTGVGFDNDVVEKILNNFDGIVLVDEAYAPFADSSATQLVNEHKNLLVTGTSSKGWGLAGMRVGWAVGSPEIIEVLDRVRDSYNLDALAQEAGIAALKDFEYYAQRCAAVISERENTEAFFDSIDWKYLKSSANFILFKPTKNGQTGAEIAADLFNFLRDKKILLRYFANEESINDAIRLTIGTPEQMMKFKNASIEWANLNK